MSSLVTIGIPCFNAEQWISRAIESGLAQTHPKTELIVVDDGSSDRSVAEIEKFGDRVRFIQTEHRGGNHARNQIIEHSRGEWLQFLDADDYLEPEKIAQQFAEAQDGSNADAIYSPYWFEKVDAANGSAPVNRWVSELDPQADLFLQWISWQLPQTGAVLWRKSALQQIGGWKEDQPCCQEHELYLRALKAGLRFVFAPTPHAVYRLWSEDTVCRKDPRRTIRVRTQLLEDARHWLLEQRRWTEAHSRTHGRACFEMSRMLAKESIEEAVTYHGRQRDAGLISPEGPAAPFSYRIVYWLLGFERAERLARARRV